MRRTIFDLVFLAGLAALDYSAAQVSHTLAWACVGVELAVIGFASGLAARSER